jgi:hypothetical protein
MIFWQSCVCRGIKTNIIQMQYDRDVQASLMMEAVRTSETSVDNHSTRQYNPEDSSEHHTRRRENLKNQYIMNIGKL